jgi:hypothetical protein
VGRRKRAMGLSADEAEEDDGEDEANDERPSQAIEEEGKGGPSTGLREGEG